MSSDMIEEFIRWKRAGRRAPETLRIRRQALEGFEQRCGPLERATHHTIIADLSDLDGTDGARQRLIAYRTFYGWATAAGHVSADPTRLVHAITPAKRLPHPTPRPAINEALAHADEATCAMIRLGFRAGLRVSEITRVHSDDVTPEGLYVWGKGARERIIPVHQDLTEHLEFTGWRFPSVSRPNRPITPQTARKRIRVATGHRAHGLRHRFATDFYEQTGDLRALQLLMGHESIETTQIYVAVADRRLAELITSLH